MYKKLVSNQKNLIPVKISLIWSFLVILQFLTSIPKLDKTNKIEGSGMFIIGLLMISFIIFLITFFWIIISNILNKHKFYIDVHYSLFILFIWIIALIIS